MVLLVAALAWLMVAPAWAQRASRAHEGTTPLHHAAAEGSSDALSKALAQHPDVNAQNGDRETALHLAARHGHADAIDRLIRSGAVVDAQDWLGETPLHLAVSSGHAAAVEVLLRAGANPNAETTRDERVLMGEFVGGETPLHRAAQTGASALVVRLLGVKSDVRVRDSIGRTPLHVVTTADGARALIAAGASLTATDRFDNEPLHLHAMGGRPDVVEVLLVAGAPPNDTVAPTGWTPLHYAAWYGPAATVKVLLAHGARVDIRDAKGNTPAQGIANLDQEEIRALLVQGL